EDQLVAVDQLRVVLLHHGQRLGLPDDGACHHVGVVRDADAISCVDGVQRGSAGVDLGGAGGFVGGVHLQCLPCWIVTPFYHNTGTLSIHFVKIFREISVQQRPFARHELGALSRTCRFSPSLVGSAISRV